MQYKVKFDAKFVYARPLVINNKTIPSGTPFHLLDAYKEGNALVVGVKTKNNGIQEALFKIRGNTKIKSKSDLRALVQDVGFLPYFEGAKYIWH